MKLTVLGCGSAYPRPGGACSGFLVQADGVNVWIDAGNGTFSNFQKLLTHRELDALVCSHRHADHIADVLPLMYARGLDDEVTSSVPMWAPPDVPATILTNRGQWAGELFAKVFDLKALQSPFEVGPLRIEPFMTVHPVETYGMRITDGGRTLVYTADTADYPRLPDDCRDADLLLCEANYARAMPGPQGMHLWAAQAGAAATKAGARRLVLTHVWPATPLQIACAEAAEAYDGPLEATVEGTVYEI